MSFGNLWERLCAKHPAFDNDGPVTLGAKGLKRLVEVAYEEGVQVGRGHSCNPCKCAKKRTTPQESSILEAFHSIFK